MSDAKKAVKLPDEFIVTTENKFGELVMRGYTKRGVDSWDKFKMAGGEWDYYDNVGDSAAMEAFNTGKVYARVIR